MWIEAILTRGDLEKALNDWCPLTIRLGNNGSLVLSDPSEIALLPGVGLSARIAARVHWPILGIQVPVTVRNATVLVTPRVLAAPGSATLTFAFHLADVDLSLFPAIVTDRLVDRVNHELATEGAELSWNFTKTLSHRFELPSALASARAIDFSAVSGRIEVTAERVALAIKMQAGVESRATAQVPSTVDESS